MGGIDPKIELFIDPKIELFIKAQYYLLRFIYSHFSKQLKVDIWATFNL